MIVLNVLGVVAMNSFPGWHTEVDDSGSETDIRPFPGKLIMGIAVALLFVSMVLVLISIMWQHMVGVTAATSISTATGGVVENHIGATSIALGWAAVGMNAIAALGIWLASTSVELLDILIDE